MPHGTWMHIVWVLTTMTKVTKMSSLPMADELLPLNYLRHYHVQHATTKYTVRMFEVLWSMCLSQAYNVYRHVNRNRRHKQMNPTEFKIDVIRGLLGHEVVVGDREDEADVVRHHLWQTEPGFAGDGTRRRKTGKCRQCPNVKEINGITHDVIRRTNYYCSHCKVHFHPQCFATWHEQKGYNFVPSKQSEF